MLWLKAFHLIFVVSWFAGLLYLPRLFVYHADTLDDPGHERFLLMERKLFGIMTIAAILATGFGVAMLLQRPMLLTLGWVQIKLVLVAGLIAYHVYCLHVLRVFRARENRYSHVWYRWFNEIPALLLIGIVLLAVLKRPV